MKITSKTLILLALISQIILFSCKKESVDVSDNELITTVKLNFTEGTTTQTFVFQDIDGAGGNAPTKFDKLALKPNKNYTMSIEILNESTNPITNTTTEIEEKKDEHLFVYTPSPVSILTVKISDKDTKGLAVGLKATAATSNAGTGKLRVQLRHQPGTKDGTATPGSEDLDLSFDVEVK